MLKITELLEVYQNLIGQCYDVQIRKLGSPTILAQQQNVIAVKDDDPGHPSDLCDLDHNVQVTFLPPNMTSLIQPMDQGDIATCKAY